MLKLQQYRAYIGEDVILTDSELRVIVDQIRALASISVDLLAYPIQAKNGKIVNMTPDFSTAVDKCEDREYGVADEHDRMEFEERAAILEYDAGVPRKEAERRARLALVRGAQS